MTHSCLDDFIKNYIVLLQTEEQLVNNQKMVWFLKDIRSIYRNYCFKEANLVNHKIINERNQKF